MKEIRKTISLLELLLKEHKQQVLYNTENERVVAQAFNNMWTSKHLSKTSTKTQASASVVVSAFSFSEKRSFFHGRVRGGEGEPRHILYKRRSSLHAVAALSGNNHNKIELRNNRSTFGKDKRRQQRYVTNTQAAQEEEVLTDEKNESTKIETTTTTSMSKALSPEKGKVTKASKSSTIPKERKWLEIQQSLTEYGLQSLSPKEAQKLVKAKKAIIVDISAKYYLQHIKDSVHVPLYKTIRAKDTLTSLDSLLSKVTLLDWGTINKNFPATAQDILGKEDRMIIVACMAGGSLTTNIDNKDKARDVNKNASPGIKSRSLRGAYELIQAGYTNVAHLEGGITAWKAEDLPMAGKKYRVVKRGKWFVNV